MLKVKFLIFGIVFFILSCSVQPSSSNFTPPHSQDLTNSSSSSSSSSITYPPYIFNGLIETNSYSGQKNFDHIFIVYFYADNDLLSYVTRDIYELSYFFHSNVIIPNNISPDKYAIFLVIEKPSYSGPPKTNGINYSPYFFEPFASFDKQQILIRVTNGNLDSFGLWIFNYNYLFEGVYFLKVSNFSSNFSLAFTNTKNMIIDFSYFFNVPTNSQTTWAYYERVFLEKNYQYSTPEKMIANLSFIRNLGLTAKTTNLIIWNHGNSVYPMGDNDTIQNKTNYLNKSFNSKYIGYSDTSRKSMSEEELTYAIKTSFNNKKLTTLMFDACNMFNIEEIYYYKDLADWFVGSSYYVPGSGFEYFNILMAFHKNYNNGMYPILFQIVSNYNANNGLKIYDNDWRTYISDALDLYYISAVSSAGINKYIYFLEKYYDTITNLSKLFRLLYPYAYITCLEDLRPYHNENTILTYRPQRFSNYTQFLNEGYYKGYAFSGMGGPYGYFLFDATDIRNSISNLIYVVNKSIQRTPTLVYSPNDFIILQNLLQEYQQDFLNNPNFFVYSHDFPALTYLRYSVFYYPRTVSYDGSINFNTSLYFLKYNKLLNDKPKVKNLIIGDALLNPINNYFYYTDPSNLVVYSYEGEAMFYNFTNSISNVSIPNTWSNAYRKTITNTYRFRGFTLPYTLKPDYVDYSTHSHDHFILNTTNTKTNFIFYYALLFDGLFPLTYYYYSYNFKDFFKDYTSGGDNTMVEITLLNVSNNITNNKQTFYINFDMLTKDDFTTSYHYKMTNNNSFPFNLIQLKIRGFYYFYINVD